MDAALDAAARGTLPAGVALERLSDTRGRAIDRLRERHRGAPLAYPSRSGQQQRRRQRLARDGARE
jgi:hypothetical protein